MWWEAIEGCVEEVSGMIWRSSHFMENGLVKKEVLVETGSPVTEETAVAQKRDINTPKQWNILICFGMFYTFIWT